MALFKVLRGSSEYLNKLPFKDGYCYFTSDTGLFYIDYETTDGIQERIPLNAQDAASLSGASLAQVLNNNELEIPSSALLNSIVNEINNNLDNFVTADEALSYEEITYEAYQALEVKEQNKIYVITNFPDEDNNESPIFTGTPTAPTAEKGTNSTQIATTAFVQEALSDIDVDLDIPASTTKAYVIGTTNTSDPKAGMVRNDSVYTEGGVLYGAAWNDYAEYRIANCREAGRVVCENGDDTLGLSMKRLQPGGNIISDTFGFAIGETEEAKTPIAVSGRVLAYTYENRETFSPGDAVCAAPNGTVSKMTREEIKEYPERIIGIVSAIPSYNYWNDGKVEVKERIWIKVK